MPLDPVSDLGEVLCCMIEGWWYLLSPGFRAKKHRQWRDQSWVGAPFDIFFGLFGIVLSLVLLGWAAWALWQWLSS